jgi:hypothetical protein
VSPLPAYFLMERTRVADLELDPIDPDDDGAADYAGPLVSDVDFAGFSHSALVRIADEVCLQMHLLVLSFQLAVRARAVDRAQADEIVTKQLTGIAGIMAERLARALGAGSDPVAALQVVRLHPLLNPAAYVTASFGEHFFTVLQSPAHDDQAWLSRVGPGSTRPLQAVVQGVDPHLDVEVVGTEGDWTAQVVRRETPAKELDEVAVTRFSKGAAFAFAPRRSLPLTVV